MGLNFSVDLIHGDIEWNGTCITKRREKRGEGGGGVENWREASK